jgi:predicted aldo/keto reductase-like oxidoreductase
MLYKPFQDLQISQLGMGNMRLPKIEGQGEKIDEPKAREIIEYAYQNGVNYFDTAYRYHAGESEHVTGNVLRQYPRDTWYLATKMPGHMMVYEDGKYHFTGLLARAPSRSPAEVFEEQLEKCSVDYFDFYLLHNLCETSYNFYTDEDIGVVTWLLEQKRKGRIRHLGFSAHCRPETLDTFLNWSKQRFSNEEGPVSPFEFVQIQLNYLDWTLQEAGKKYDIVTKHGLPVITMESCRGGRLVSLGEKSNALLKQRRPHDSITSWAFRFLQSLPNVQVVLSGMTSMEQLKENIETFSKNDPVRPEEKKLLGDAIKPLYDIVPCTACRYCCEGCPRSLDIPKLISMYNEAKLNDTFTWMQLGFTLDAMAETELPQACIGCGGCAKFCPQNIDIPVIMKKFSELLVGRLKK